MKYFPKKLILCSLLCAAACCMALNVAAEDATSQKAPAEKPLFTFAVMADVQYADKYTGNGYDYRSSLGNLKKCVKVLNACKPAFTIQLGDIVDGNDPHEKTISDYESVMTEYDKLTMPTYHVFGNHCVSIGKDYVKKRTKIERFYYDYTVPQATGWRFVVLDCNDEGGFSQKQLKWLKDCLTKARTNKEKVIIFCHYPMPEIPAENKESKDLNLGQVISEAGCVVAYIAGHTHTSTCTVKSGIYCLTLSCMLSNPSSTFGVFQVYQDKIVETGYGSESSRVLKLNTYDSAQKAAQ